MQGAVPSSAPGAAPSSNGHEEKRMEQIRLNLGAGDNPIEGYDNTFDIKHGKNVFPLDVAPASVDEIRASHILEHFSHTRTVDVLKDWVAALKPGGMMKLSVPNFEALARGYINGEPWPFQGFVCGSHADAHDVHLVQFDYWTLSEAMRAAGLVGIHAWKGDDEDCSGLPISLNLAGWKRYETFPRINAVMSMPRLAFTENYFAVIEGLGKLGVKVHKTTGAFWGQCMTRGIERALEEDKPDYILTIDYDTLFNRGHVEDLLAFMQHFSLDAVCPIQMSRSTGFPMFVPKDAPEGRVYLEMDKLIEPLTELDTGHFGLTLLRASRFQDLPRPWFDSRPDPEGSWHKGRVDDDIYFWHNWKRSGRTLHMANRVCVGHLELMAIWPNREMRPLYQHPGDWAKDGVPSDVWR